MTSTRRIGRGSAYLPALPIRWISCRWTERATAVSCQSWWSRIRRRYTFWKTKQHPGAYIDQMWAEAMTIYHSGDFRLSLPKELEEEARNRQKAFMPEDTTSGRIQCFLDVFGSDDVCSRQIFELGLGRMGEPKQWEIREINDIMNHTIEGWEPGTTKRISGYGIQRTWHRRAGVGVEQLELPEGW